MKTRVRLIAPLVALVLASGCALALRSPSIGELKQNPARFHDKTVSVDGVVTSSWRVPLVPFRVYRIDDGTGELTIVSQGQRTPTKGTHVRVKGKVADFAVIGGQSFGLHIREQSLHVKGN